MTKLTDAEYGARRRAYRERPEVKAQKRAYYAKIKAELAEFRAWKAQNK